MDFEYIIETLKNLSSYNEKGSFLSSVLYSLKSKKIKLKENDKKMLAQFTFKEIEELIFLIPTVKSYKEKDGIFGYEDSLLGLVMACRSSPAEISKENLNNINILIELVNKERFLEMAIDDIFEKDINDRATVEKLISMLSSVEDEFHRGQLYQGLAHYRNKIDKLPPESKQALGDYINAEMKRLSESGSDETILNNLEFACDIAKYFVSDSIINRLYECLKLKNNAISFYAIGSLLDAKCNIPSDVVASLANDLIYADITYSLLSKHGKQNMFPSELANDEYLAKSDLVHWLTYPTELGKAPDEIELLGKVRKNGDYYIFKFKSDSDTLSDELKNKYLIGWANNDGGTFSNFDLYESFEQKTIEKTLKKIKKIL
ncbi:MAG: hypothetical protein II984_05820 [Clostridia bacterium]|nr:hypothetical protein [Clostridia bacterium]